MAGVSSTQTSFPQWGQGMTPSARRFANRRRNECRLRHRFEQCVWVERFFVKSLRHSGFPQRSILLILAGVFTMWASSSCYAPSAPGRLHRRALSANLQRYPEASAVQEESGGGGRSEPPSGLLLGLLVASSVRDEIFGSCSIGYCLCTRISRSWRSRKIRSRWVGLLTTL